MAVDRCGDAIGETYGVVPIVVAVYRGPSGDPRGVVLGEAIGET